MSFRRLCSCRRVVVEVYGVAVRTCQIQCREHGAAPQTQICEFRRELAATRETQTQITQSLSMGTTLWGVRWHISIYLHPEPTTHLPILVCTTSDLSNLQTQQHNIKSRIDFRSNDQEHIKSQSAFRPRQHNISSSHISHSPARSINAMIGVYTVDAFGRNKRLL